MRTLTINGKKWKTDVAKNRLRFRREGGGPVLCFYRKAKERICAPVLSSFAELHIYTDTVETDEGENTDFAAYGDVVIEFDHGFKLV